MRRSGIGSTSLAIAWVVLGLIVAGPDPARADSESWDAVYLGGSKVGHMRIRVAPVQDEGRQLTRVLVDFELSFKRGNDLSTMKLEYGTIETPEGQVLRLDTRTLVGQQVLRQGTTPHGSADETIAPEADSDTIPEHGALAEDACQRPEGHAERA